MTQKSASRIMRDARKQRAEQYQKDNRVWDDLDVTYRGCLEALRSHRLLATMLERREVFPFLTDAATLVENIRSISRDIQQMHRELEEIHVQHASRTGGTADPDEVMFSFQIFEQYNLFVERHNSVVLPTVYHICEIFNQAELAYNAAVQAQQEQQAQLATPVTLEGEVIDSKVVH